MFNNQNSLKIKEIQPDWKNLADDCCPLCGQELLDQTITDKYICTSTKCSFKISSEKFEEIKEDLFQKALVLQKEIMVCLLNEKFYRD